MSKVRRIRYVEQYPYLEDYGGTKDPPVKHYRDWIEIEVFEDAAVQHVTKRHDMPGKSYMLRVPMTDPETGGATDADGDRALLRVQMVGAEIEYIGGSVTVKGFVSRQELAHEVAYRSGDIEACLASYDEASDYEYVREEWQVLRS